MGCVHRCTFCYVRGFEQRADRPSDDRYGTSIRVKLNVAEVLRRELAAPALARRGDRDRRRDRSVPARRGPLPPDARVPRGAARRRQPVLDHHARPADRARRRRARRGVAPRGRLGDVLGPDGRRRRLAHDRAGHGAAAAAAARAARRSSQAGVRAVGRDGAAPPRPLRPPEPARTRSSPRHARQARAASGRTSSTCARERASTSSRASPRDWPELLPEYERLYAARRLPRRKAEAEPARDAVRRLARAHGIRDRRAASRCGRPQRDEQLSLSLTTGIGSHRRWPRRDHRR